LVGRQVTLAWKPQAGAWISIHEVSLMPSEIRFGALVTLVSKHGWVLIRVRGSHHVFKKPDGSTYSIPVHHGKVKPFYVREIKKQLGED
jgi:predicted RNA binding protein YcfA (HicA-like mRNA interferase family)